MSSLANLKNEELLEIYKKAETFHLNREFLQLIKEELCFRNIELTKTIKS